MSAGAAMARVKDAVGKAKRLVKQALVRRKNGHLRLDYGADGEFYEIMRLTSGKAEVGILLWMLSETKSAARGDGAAAPKFTACTSWETIAQYVGGYHEQKKKSGGAVSEKTIQLALKRLLAARVIEQDPKTKHYQAAGGYRACTELWADLAPYVTPKLETMPAPEEPAEEDEEDEKRHPSGEDEKRHPSGEVRVFTKPLRIRPGRACRPAKLPYSPDRVTCSSDAEIAFDATLYDGTLQIFVRLEEGLTGNRIPERKANATGSRIPNSNVASDENKGLDRGVGGSGRNSAVPSDLAAGDGFPQFMASGIRCKLRASEEDWKKAALTWKTLSIEHRLAAVQGLNDHFEAGDTEFLGLPQNFLKNKAWQRGVRKRVDPKEQGRQELREWARDVTPKGA